MPDLNSQKVSRRQFMKRSAAGFLGFAGAASIAQTVSCKSPATQTAKPNIVIMIADDAGWRDVGYHGSEIKTPHLDKFIQEGVELNHFYVYPTCSPTRASLLAGRPPSRWGILGPIGGRSKLALPHESPTIADLLRGAGYRTALSGKWHLGLRLEVGPRKYGFDSTYGYLHGQIDQYTHHYKNGDKSWHRNDQFITEKGHATDLIRDEAIRVINEWGGKEKPLFLYVAWSVPHYPLQEPARWVDLYKDSIQNESRRIFAASVTHMDDAVGQILNAIKEKGIAKETLVIFISDNGAQKNWTSHGEYNDRFGPYDRLGDNRPLRDWKGSVYEGAIRVPAMLQWLGKLAPGKVDESIIVYDILPTIAHLVGVQTTPEMKYEGKNVWPAITENSKIPERVLYRRTGHQMAVRKGDWKLVHIGKNPQEGKDELYNVAIDPDERTDLAQKEPAKLKELKDALAVQFERDA